MRVVIAEVESDKAQQPRQGPAAHVPSSAIAMKRLAGVLLSILVITRAVSSLR